MTKNTYEPGQVILNQNEKINEIMIVINGILNVFDYIDGSEFIIDILPMGTIIN